MSTISDFLSASRLRLRVIEGPLVGTTFSLTKRFLIGRDATADLRLFDQEVSRQHAEVVSGPNDGHWLVDLDSSNGTFIGSRRIERVELKLDTTFRIRGNRFIYEQEVAVKPDVDEEPRVAPPSGTPQRRETIEYDMSSPQWQLRPPGEVATPSDDLCGTTVVNEDGVPYPGNIVADIAGYWALERRMARNELDSTDELDELERLRRNLYPTDDRGNPTDARFTCRFPAALRLPSGQGLSIELVEIGVDGALCSLREHGLERGSEVWLITAIITGLRTQTLVLPCKVAWARAEHLSLAFATHEQSVARRTHDRIESSLDEPTLDRAKRDPMRTIRSPRPRDRREN